MRLDELAKQIGAELVGDGAIEINSTATLDDAGPGQLTFLSNPKYIKRLETTRAAAVIVSLDTKSAPAALLKSADPYYAFCQAVVVLHGYRKHPHQGIHPGAHVDPTATIGENTIVYPGVYVGPRARVGRDCILYPNAVLYDDTLVGDRVIIHSGAVLGNDGYGFATHKGIHHKIPQTGNVVIEDDVEIGANCCIARAAIGSTVIGQGTKMDCLIIIGHGARFGPHCLVVAQVGVAGSVVVGHHVTIAGQVGIAGHVKIGNNCVLAAQSGIANDLEEQSVVFGSPSLPMPLARRAHAIYAKLPELVQRIRHLEQQVEELSDSGDVPMA